LAIQGIQKFLLEHNWAMQMVWEKIFIPILFKLLKPVLRLQDRFWIPLLEKSIMF
jgi:hypothetical protein